MASEVEIVNRGLLAIGANAVLNLTENSIAAVAANRIYADVRDAVLSAHTWNFAIKRAILAPSGTEPLFEWSYKLPLPADFIRIVPSYYLEKLNGPHKEEGGYIFADTNAFYLKYVCRETNVNLYSPLFKETLGARIGAELAIILSNDKNMEAKQLKIYGEKLKEARFVDAVQDTPEDVEADEWIMARA